MSWLKKFTRGKGQPAPTTPMPAATSGCGDHPRHLREGTADFEWFIAQGELASGNHLAHGASHLATLLSYAPGKTEWIELIERYLAACPDLEALIPRGDKLYYSTEALRAYIWNHQGRRHDAIDLLLSVTQAKPTSRYLEGWCIDWLEPSGAVEGLPPALGLRLFATVATLYPEASQLTRTRLRDIIRWSHLSERFAAHHPDLDNSALMVRLGLLRRSGRYEDALAIARPALERSPSWHAATALGLILRAQGNFDAADHAFQAALELDPDDIAACLEAGDMHWEQDRWQPAAEWYERALQKRPDNAWASATLALCRWRLSDQKEHLDALTRAAEAGNERAAFLMHREFSSGLPEPVDAIANMLRDLRESAQNGTGIREGDSMTIALSCLEAPSNLIALRLDMDAIGSRLKVQVDVESVPVPDPRQPIEDVKYPLWKYEGTNAFPGLPPPGPDILTRIAELACTRFDPQANWAAASHEAARIGAPRIGEVLAAMVHPPPVPSDRHALSWLPRVQLVAAQIAAQIDEGWDGSIRREALLSVLWGPQDWTTEAAIRALAHLGAEQEPIAPDIHEAFQRLADHMPDSFCCWAPTLYRCWLQLPHLFPSERETLEKKLHEFEEPAE